MDAPGSPAGSMLQLLAAFEFMADVKNTFRGDEGKFGRFLQILNSFREPQPGFDQDAALVSLNEVLAGYPRLIAGMNQFLHPDHQIGHPPPDN